MVPQALKGRLPGPTSVYLWLLAYWMAFIVNMTFDVYLEGPQGGIWFWCLIGFTIALIEAEKPKVPAPSPSPPARALAGGGSPSGGRSEARQQEGDESWFVRKRL